MPKRRYFNYEITKKLTDTTIDRIVDEIVKTNKERHYTKVSGKDVTTAFDKIEFGIRRGDKDNILEEEDTLTANVRYSTDNEIVVSEGAMLVVAFWGITANDICKVVVNGYEIDNN